MKIPHLTTERMVLTPPVPDHAPDIHRYASDSRFCAFIDSTVSRTIDETASFVRNLIAENEAGSRLYWVAVRREDERAIGTLGLIFSAARRHRVAELGYGFAPETWGTGLFQEAGAEIIRFAFEELGLRRVQAITRADNIAAVKGVQKFGMNREATLKSFYQTEYGRVDAAILAILSSDEPSTWQS